MAEEITRGVYQWQPIEKRSRGRPSCWKRS